MFQEHEDDEAVLVFEGVSNFDLFLVQPSAEHGQPNIRRRTEHNTSTSNIPSSPPNILLFINARRSGRCLFVQALVRRLTPIEDVGRWHETKVIKRGQQMRSQRRHRVYDP